MFARNAPSPTTAAPTMSYTAKPNAPTAPTGGPGSFIGKQIDLLTKAHMRYRGVLETVDPVERLIHIRRGAYPALSVQSLVLIST